MRDASARVPSRTKTSVVFASGLAAGRRSWARAEERSSLRKKWPASWAPLQGPETARLDEALEDGGPGLARAR